MDSTWSDIYDITLSWLDDIEDFIHSTILAPVIELLSRNLAGESAVHLCSRLGIHHIPYLGLSERIISLSRDLVIRMHLNRKLVVDIQELDEQRELTSIIVIDILSDNSLKIGLHELAYGIACKPAICDNGIFNAHIGKLPAFADKHVRTENCLVAVFVDLYKVLAHFCNKGASSPWSP